ncbi:hypothetical protein F5148DRAFT_1261329 [Russula earlei]|uniref:Uncharacterized protein n=1 Tax=Russula earlei TaxID=71964 RepID=A0ACC0TS58_9AGAM|nr:hypothetical protein F5148DRAFT_1261329 [Russula earlei]
MRTSVFSIFCLAVGNAPSFALPAGNGNPGFNGDHRASIYDAHLQVQDYAHGIMDEMSFNKCSYPEVFKNNPGREHDVVHQYQRHMSKLGQELEEFRRVCPGFREVDQALNELHEQNCHQQNHKKIYDFFDFLGYREYF